MKYIIELYRNQRASVYIDAETPEAAIRQARLENKGFQADNATEIDMETEETGNSFEVFGECENCSKLIFFGEPQVTTLDDVTICGACHEALEQKEGE